MPPPHVPLPQALVAWQATELQTSPVHEPPLQSVLPVHEQIPDARQLRPTPQSLSLLQVVCWQDPVVAPEHEYVELGQSELDAHGSEQVPTGPGVAPTQLEVTPQSLPVRQLCAPHNPGPPAPQACPLGQLPQLSRPPQPSPAGPHCRPSDAQVAGTQPVPVPHRPEPPPPQVCPVLQVPQLSVPPQPLLMVPHLTAPQLWGVQVAIKACAETWKSLNTTRPHWFAAEAPRGVLNVNRFV